VVETPPCQGGDRWFESCLLIDSVAQLGECHFDRVEAAGSSPGGIIIKKPELKGGVRVFCFNDWLYPEITVDNFYCVISFIDVPIIIGMGVC
jgi:hypothetical protein